MQDPEEPTMKSLKISISRFKITEIAFSSDFRINHFGYDNKHSYNVLKKEKSKSEIKVSHVTLQLWKKVSHVQSWKLKKELLNIPKNLKGVTLLKPDWFGRVNDQKSSNWDSDREVFIYIILLKCFSNRLQYLDRITLKMIWMIW